MTPPPAGTWCIECMTQGHRCQAQMFGEDHLPVCLPCANGDPCVVARVGVPKPPELFEVEPGYEPAPVITRTPEELGIPRVVEPGAEPPPEPRNPYSQSRVYEKPLRAHDYQQDGKEPDAMPQGIRLTEEQKQAVAAAGHSGLSAGKIARKYGIGEETARRVCREAGVPPLPPMGPPPGPRGPYKKRKGAEAPTTQPTPDVWQTARTSTTETTPVDFGNDDALDCCNATAPELPVDPTECLLTDPIPPELDSVSVSLQLDLTHKKADELWADFTLAEKATCIRRAIEDRWNGL